VCVYIYICSLFYVCTQIKLLRQKTDFQETGTRCYAGGGHTNVYFKKKKVF